MVQSSYQTSTETSRSNRGISLSRKPYAEFIIEAEGKGLTIFDIDDTMFKTKARVNIMKDGEIVRKINNQEYNTYKLKRGESYDYGEMRSAKIFKKSIPIQRMIEKVKVVLKNATKVGSRVIIVTARPNFDKKEMFLDVFRDQGIDINQMYVERAGNLDLGSAAKNKRFILHKYLKSGEYKRIRLFDDSNSNLTSFLALQKHYPDVSFEAWKANPDGSVTKKAR